MVELSALDDRLLGLPLRLQIEERLPAPLLALELESILFFTAIAALLTGVGSWPPYTFPIALFGLVAAALAAESPRGAGPRLLVHFGYFELLSILLDVFWLLSSSPSPPALEGDKKTGSALASFAMGVTTCFKLVVLLKVAQRLQEAGLLGVPPGGSGLPGPTGGGGGPSLPGGFPSRPTRTPGYEAFLPPEDAPGYRDHRQSYEYDAEALERSAHDATVFDSEEPSSVAPIATAPVKLPSP